MIRKVPEAGALRSTVGRAKGLKKRRSSVRVATEAICHASVKGGKGGGRLEEEAMKLSAKFLRERKHQTEGPRRKKKKKGVAPKLGVLGTSKENIRHRRGRIPTRCSKSGLCVARRGVQARRRLGDQKGESKTRNC